MVVMSSPLAVDLAGRDLLRPSDFVPAESEAVLDLAAELKAGPRHEPLLPGRSLGLLFYKHSTRTRVSFAAGMTQLGGAAIPLEPEQMQLSRGESLHDTAEVLSRYLDAIAIRTYAQADLEAWAEASSIPIVNALTDEQHPCQALADVLTIRERLGGTRRRAHRVARRRHERARLARGARRAARHHDGRRVPGGLRARRSSPGRSCATRARRSRAPTSSSPTRGRAWARRTGASSGCATSSRTASTRSC